MPPEPDTLISLSISQQFETERMNRIIDNTSDVVALRALAKQCFTAWQVQRSAAQAILGSTLPNAIDFRAAVREMAPDSETGKLPPTGSLGASPALS
jgi:hypothetical protein